MKRIVKGYTYNTDTSGLLAQWDWEHHDYNGAIEGRGIDRLYRTRGGAFFLHEEKTVFEWDERERETREQVHSDFIPMKIPAEANKWLLETDGVEVFSNPFGDPPEAEATSETEATIYVRVPASIKRRVEEEAGAESVSVNHWVIRCLEQRLNAKARSKKNGAKKAPKAATKQR